MSLKLKLELCNYRDRGAHPTYGSVIVTCAQLTSNSNHAFEIKDAQGTVSGSIIFENVVYTKKPSFVEYLRSGWHINMAVAIDFTGSNGEIYSADSLHRQHPDGKLNDYELAIKSVGSILEPYAYE